MLDAFIIDKIRREQERARRDSELYPLHIDISQDHHEPPPADRSLERDEPEDTQRGVTVIDFSI